MSQQNNQTKSAGFAIQACRTGAKVARCLVTSVFPGALCRLMALLVGIPIAGCASTGTIARSDLAAIPSNQPAFIVRWLPSCSPNEVAPYFSIELYSNALVKYRGGPSVKEIGERTLTISEQSANRLYAAGLRYARAASRKRALPEHGATYCLDVASLGAAGRVESRARNDSHLAQRFEDVIDEIVNPRQWACPARVKAADPYLYPRDYCRVKAAFVLTLHDERGCYMFHDVYVYEDGTVYYLERHTTMRQGAKPRYESEDHYYRAMRGEVADMIRRIREFPALQSPDIEEPGVSKPPLLYRARPEDVREITKILEGAAGITWVAPEPNARDACDDQMITPSRLHLRTDLETPDSVGSESHKQR